VCACIYFFFGKIERTKLIIVCLLLQTLFSSRSKWKMLLFVLNVTRNNRYGVFFYSDNVFVSRIRVKREEYINTIQNIAQIIIIIIVAFEFNLSIRARS